jgi:hypothetical protein
VTSKRKQPSKDKMANAIPVHSTPAAEAPVEAPVEPVVAPAVEAPATPKEPDYSRATRVERRPDGSVSRVDW